MAKRRRPMSAEVMQPYTRLCASQTPGRREHVGAYAPLWSYIRLNVTSPLNVKTFGRGPQVVFAFPPHPGIWYLITSRSIVITSTALKVQSCVHLNVFHVLSLLLVSYGLHMGMQL